MQDECWLFAGRTNKGDYGEISSGGKNHRAHRVMFENLIGEIPEGLVLDHLCRVTRCINPGHLEPVTIKENNLRGVGIMAQNARKTHCPQGHEYTPENLYTRNSDGARKCRACSRAEAHNRYHTVVAPVKWNKRGKHKISYQ